MGACRGIESEGEKTMENGTRVMRRLAILAGLVLLLIAALSPAPAAAQTEPRFRALLFTKTDAFRHDSIPAGVAAVQELARGQQLHRGPHGGLDAVQRRQPRQLRRRDLAEHDRRRPQRDRAGSVRALHPGRRRLRRRPLGGGHGVRLALVRRAGGRLLPVAPRDPGGDGEGRRPRASGDPAPAGELGAHGRVVQLPHQSAGQRPRPRRRSTRGPTTPARARWAPITRSPGARTSTAAGPSTPAAGTLGVVLRAGVPPAPARRHRDRGRRDARRLRRDRVVELREGRRWTRTRAIRSSSTSRPTGASSSSSAAATSRSSGPTRQSTVVAGHVDVFTGQENGLLGIALDPAFATNDWVYLFYAATGTRRARRAIPGDALRPAAALALHGQRQHAGPGLRAGAARVPDPARRVLPLRGHARLRRGRATCTCRPATTPTRSRRAASRRSTSAPGRSSCDAQRTSANTNDLRGKLLRIHPEPDGTYTDPGRQPVRRRHRADPARDLRDGLPQPVPDRRSTRRPAARRRRLRARRRRAGPEPRAGGLRSSSTRSRAAGNYGWPYCIGNHFPFNDYDFATGTSGALFNCAAPVNDSPNNTGLTQPAAGPGAGSGTRYGLDGVPRARHRLRLPDGRARLPLRPRPAVRAQALARRRMDPANSKRLPTV